MSVHGDDHVDAVAREVRRYVDEDIDQFVHFRLVTKYGEVYVGITRSVPEGHPIEASIVRTGSFEC